MQQTPPQKEYLNYFGEKEKASLGRFAAARDKILSPLIKVLVRFNLSAKIITLVSFLLLLIFFPILYQQKIYWAALIVLLVHIFLDSIDGNLARATNSASNSGALCDMLNDVTGLVIVALTAAFCSESSFQTCLLVFYAVLYLYFTVFIVVQNVLKKQFNMIIRSKYLFYIVLFSRAFGVVDILTVFVLICCIHMSVHSVLSLKVILKNLD